MKLILIRGLPGSGKTTCARGLVDATRDTASPMVHIEADQYYEVGGDYFFDGSWVREAHRRCFRLTKAVLEGGRDVVVSNTFTRVWEMQHYLDLAEHNLMIDVAVLKCIGNYESVHDVPQKVMERMKARWEDYEHEGIYNG